MNDIKIEELNNIAIMDLIATIARRNGSPLNELIKDYIAKDAVFEQELFKGEQHEFGQMLLISSEHPCLCLSEAILNLGESCEDMRTNITQTNKILNDAGKAINGYNNPSLENTYIFTGRFLG